MILADNLIEIGYITRQHGLKGEMQATVTDPVFDDVKSCPYLVIEMDGIFVPFFIESYRFRSDTTILLKLDDIDSQEQADPFCGKTLYFDRRCFSKKEAKAYDQAAEEEMGLIGYTVEDKSLGELGPITEINDQTANVLFIVDHDGEELMIPAAEPLILSIDDEKRRIVMDLPVGLVNIEDAMTDE